MPGHASDSAVQAQSPPCLPRTAAALYLLGMLSYFSMPLVDPEHITGYGETSLTPRMILVIVLAVILQVVAVTVTDRFPYRVFAVMAVTDPTILIASDRSSVGSTVIMVAIQYLMRYRAPDWQIALFINIIISNLVFLIRKMYSSERGPVVVIVFLSAHLLQCYLLPVVATGYTLGCEQLHRVLRDKAEFLKREKQLFEREECGRAAYELRVSRSALAHNPHDIAGHHFSGVIISAQAAVALRYKDPERSNQIFQTVQDSARTVLIDLRQVVSLLRNEDRSDSQHGGQVTDGQQSELTSSSTEATAEPVVMTDSRMVRESVLLPSLEAVPHLVEESRRRQQWVGYAVSGRPCPLSLLAGTAAYRMVQESLANCARYASGAPCQVWITYQQRCMGIVVSNRCPPNAGACQAGTGSEGDGYGLSGMAERMALAGVELTTGPDPDGGWRDRLAIPVPPTGADGSRTEGEVAIP